MLEVAGRVEGHLVVDSCCGTGDVALAFAHAGARVVGVDFTPEMLTRAQAKLGARHASTVFAHGDALRLPVQSRSADLCTNAFGIRNVSDRRAGIREMQRVLRPGGRVVILEFSLPPGRILGALYRGYFTRVLPLVGRLVSRDADAYSYLPRTVLAWPRPGELQRELEGEAWSSAVTAC
jgi:demethylmenaquinone methyltransferase/2-methoxy-6-polyprenyl-1,4-benzoquinol methylase